MSLLLDARKKSLDTQSGDAGRSGSVPGMEAHPTAAATSSHNPLPTMDKSRMAGQNLFGAKSSSASSSFAGINRNLLVALGGTVVLLAAGGGYVWYVTSAGNNQPVRPIARAPVPSSKPITQQPPAIAENPPESSASPEAASSKPASVKKPVRTTRPATRRPTQRAGSNAPPLIERHQAESIDPLLNSAYLAYREGKLEQAQQLYLQAFKLDERNTDVLLGLAAVAQRRGENNVAAHYYSKVLELNPRDAVANAGMSALATNGNIESRLKILLNEQQDSSSLYFALGNFYATQERWGEAQQAYFHAYKLEPANAGLSLHLAISLDRLGQKKLAAQYYQGALQLDQSRSNGFDHAKISQRIEELSR